MTLDTFTSGAHVKITNKDHPHADKTGRLVQFQKYGPGGMFYGWLTKLDDGMSTFIKREDAKVI